MGCVLNFIAQRWHKWNQPITAADIARVRQETAGRKTPWTHEELKARTRQKPGKP